MANYTNSTVLPSKVIPSTTAKALFSVTDTQATLVVVGFLITMVLTFFGNILVITVVYRQRLMRNIQVTNSFLANLAVIDLLMSVLVLPFCISINLEHDWIFGDTFCDFNGMFTLFVGSASILTMSTISIDRYRAVKNAGRNRLSIKQAYIMIAVIWVWSLAIGMMPIFGWSSYSWAPGSSVCKFSFTEERGFVVLLIVSCFVFPVTTMLFCYISVFVLLRKHQKQLNKWKEAPMTVSKKAQAKNMKHESRATLVVFIILSVFCLCWVPYVIINALKLINPNAVISSGAFLFASWSTTAHAAANPIVYIIWNKKFRIQAAKILPFARCCLAKIGPLDEERSEYPQTRTVRVGIKK